MIIDNPQALQFIQTQFLVGEGFQFALVSDLESDEEAETLLSIVVGRLLYIKKAALNESIPVWQRKLGN